MVKGVTKQVVVVRCPDTRYFDEAFFMVREEALTQGSPEQLLKEACRVADNYMREHTEKKKKPWGWILGGLGAVGMIALMLVLVL